MHRVHITSLPANSTQNYEEKTQRTIIFKQIFSGLTHLKTQKHRIRQRIFFTLPDLSTLNDRHSTVWLGRWLAGPSIRGSAVRSPAPACPSRHVLESTCVRQTPNAPVAGSRVCDWLPTCELTRHFFWVIASWRGALPQNECRGNTGVDNCLYFVVLVVFLVQLSGTLCCMLWLYVIILHM